MTRHDKSNIPNDMPNSGCKHFPVLLERRSLSDTVISRRDASIQPASSQLAASSSCAIGSGSSLCSLLLSNVFSVMLVVVGGLTLFDCPAQPLIPIWMLAMGAVCILKTAFTIFLQIQLANRHKANAGRLDKVSFDPVDVFLWAMLIAVFIFGVAVVYFCTDNLQTISPLILKEGEPTFCNTWTYGISFWYITMSLGMTLSVLFCLCLSGGTSAIRVHCRNRDHPVRVYHTRTRPPVVNV